MTTPNKRPVDEDENVDIEAIEPEPTYYDDEENIIDGCLMASVLVDDIDDDPYSMGLNETEDRLQDDSIYGDSCNW